MRESRSVLPLVLRKLMVPTSFWTCLIGIDLYPSRKSIQDQRFLILISKSWFLRLLIISFSTFIHRVIKFCSIKKDSGISFSDMIFFDDEHRNIKDLEKVGVLSIHVKDGMSMNVLKAGFQRFETQKLNKKSSEL